MNPVVELSMRFVFNFLPRLGAPRYEFNLGFLQLAFCITEISRTASSGGSIVEVGVARGMTSRLLCQHFRHLRASIEFHVIDTFGSFGASDVEYEVHVRGKPRSALRGFAYNNLNTWRRNLAAFPFLVVGT